MTLGRLLGGAVAGRFVGTVVHEHRVEYRYAVYREAIGSEVVETFYLTHAEHDIWRAVCMTRAQRA